MYQKPKLEYYGTFRELTHVGASGPTDGVPVTGITGDNACSIFPGVGTCSS